MGSSPDETKRPETHGADLAALIGATIAVLFTVTNTPGAWGVQSTIIGLLLLAVLLAFFRGRRPSAEQRKSSVGQPGERLESFLIGCALSVVVASVAAIAGAQVVQVLWFSNNDSGLECRSVAVEQAVTAVHDLNDRLPNVKSDKPPSDKRDKNLQHLVDDTLQNGHPSGPFTATGSTEEAQALKITFYDEYDDALGNCLAGYTTNSLWWIAVPSFVVTLAWWNWNYIKTWRIWNYTKRWTARKKQGHISGNWLG
jgi:MYXO-CTERM domain-containing protein